MNIEGFFTFLIGMTILAATPGPGIFASMSKAVSEGFKSSLYFICGLIIGDIIFFLLALFGLSAISFMMGDFFYMIKIAGGLYLIYLGIKIFRKKSLEIKNGKNSGKTNTQNIISGLLITLGNPKPILFYASILPAIFDISKVTFAEASVMISLIIFLLLIIVGSYSYFASLTRKLIIKEKTEERINKGAGIMLAAAGSYLILK